MNITRQDIEKLAEAYGCSTWSRDLFHEAAEVLYATRGEERYEGDGAVFVEFGNCTLSYPDDAHVMEFGWVPEVIWSDGGCMKITA